jgi:hypothetical protein
MDKQVHTWELWFPDAGSTGLEFARARIDPTDVLWVHAAPPNLAVTVREGKDRIIAQGEPLQREGKRYPMTRLTMEGNTIRREDRWPRREDLGALVILHGGEVGTLLEWWNVEDGSEWRWRVEFYNRT